MWQVQPNGLSVQECVGGAVGSGAIVGAAIVGAMVGVGTGGAAHAASIKATIIAIRRRVKDIRFMVSP